MNKSLEDLEAELAVQDEELARVTAAFEELPPGARYEVPTSFFEELDATCEARATVAAQPIYGLRA